MTIRNTLIATAAGLLMGVSAGPDRVEAAPTFPIYIDFNYCWSSTTPCPRNYIDTFILYSDGTMETESGFADCGVPWTWTKATKTVTIHIGSPFCNSSATYWGIHEGQGAISGTMENHNYGSTGTWSGEVRL